MKRLTIGALLSIATLFAASAAERDHVVLSVSSVSVKSGYSNESVLYFEFEPASAKVLAEFSARHVGDQVSILVAGQEVSRPFLREPLKNGQMNLTCDQGACSAIAKQIDDAKVIAINSGP